MVVGAGEVGAAVTRIAAHRDFFDHLVLLDPDPDRARSVVGALGPDARLSHGLLDDTDDASVARSVRDGAATHVLDCGSHGALAVFRAALAARVHYLGTALSPSRPVPGAPEGHPGVKLGDEQFAADAEWRKAARLALVGMGAAPGLSDVFARFAADHLFVRVEEFAVRAGPGGSPGAGSSRAEGRTPGRDSDADPGPGGLGAGPGRPVVWSAAGGWRLVEAVEPEVFHFPGGIGPVECVHAEHAEVLLIPRYLGAHRVTFKHGPGSGDHPAACTGVLVTGVGLEGTRRSVYLHHLVEAGMSTARDGVSASAWQTAVAAVVALELVARGIWAGRGVKGPEAFDSRPFLELLGDPAAYDAPWALEERLPAPA